MPEAATTPASPASRAPWWLWPNLLSLDAPLVACVWLWFFGACERLSFEWEIYVALGGAVWCIYVGDRLADVWRTGARTGETGGVGRPSTVRLAFFRLHWKAFLGALLMVAPAVMAVALWRVPEKILWYGARASVLVLVYFWQNLARVNRWAGGALAAILVVVLASVVWEVVAAVVWQLGLSPGLGDLLLYGYVSLGVLAVVLAIRGHPAQIPTLLPKEALCGITFAIGVTIPVFAYSTARPQDFFTGAGVVLFACLCTLNCLAISLIERDADRVDDPAALPQRFPAIGRAFPSLALVLAVVAVAQAVDSRGGKAAILYAVAASALLLGALWVFRARVSGNAYRVFADLSLLTPLAVAPILGT
ncbi:hypothetical protein BH23VER1_BH23VER1_17960 [soil metagenome]